MTYTLHPEAEHDIANALDFYSEQAGSVVAGRFLEEFERVAKFRHKGLRKYFESGSLAGIQPAHANRLKMQLAALDTAQTIEDMDIPGFRLHALKGSDRGRWSIWVNGNWRVTF